MHASSAIDRVAVAARTGQGRLCTVTVERGRLGGHVLRYDGSEDVVAELSPEVIELLPIALSVVGRTTIWARLPGGDACTLLVVGQLDGARLYFHAAAGLCAVFDRAGADRLRGAVEQLRSG